MHEFRKGEPLVIFIKGSPTNMKENYKLLVSIRDVIIEAAKRNVKRIDMIGLELDPLHIDIAQYYRTSHKSFKTEKDIEREMNKYFKENRLHFEVKGEENGQ